MSFRDNLISEITKRAVVFIFGGFFGFMALFLPPNQRIIIAEKFNALATAIPSPVYLLFILIITIAYLVHFLSLSKKLAEAKEREKPDEEISMFGLRWKVSKKMKLIQDPLCPACGSALTKFRDDQFAGRYHQGKTATFMECARCNNQHYAVDNSGSPMTLSIAKRTIAETIFR